MFSNIKNRFQSVQKDISQSLKSLRFGENDGKQNLSNEQKACDLTAGSEILSYYQKIWKDIHNSSEINSKTAQEVDGLISDVNNYVKKEYDVLKQLNYEICMLPEIVCSIQNLTSKIGDVESLMEDVHGSIIQLENLIDEGKFQEHQVDEKFKFTLYKERKLAEYESYKFQLENRHQEKIREQAFRQAALLREKQEIFKEAFEEEMENYRSSGRLDRPTSPSSAKPFVDLSDVTLDEDHKELDDFLAETQTEEHVSNAEDDVDESEKPANN